MTKEREALKLALEALKQMKAQANFDCWNLDICDEAIATAEEVLAQPEQEPFRFTNKENWLSGNGRMWSEMYREEGDFPVYTTPPQRTWVGLTDDEFEDIELGCRSTPFGKIEAMRMVEAKLKEKNT